MRIIILILGMVFMFSNMTTAQDLIENTRAGIQRRVDAPQNELAQLVKYKKESYATIPKVSFWKNSPRFQRNAYSNKVQNAVVLKLDELALANFWENASSVIELEIPVGNQNAIRVELIETDILSKTFQVQTASGVQPILEDALFYRGTVVGDPSSLVSMSVFQEEVRLLIGDAQGTYVLNALPNNNREYVLYNESNLNDQLNPFCGTNDEENAALRSVQNEDVLMAMMDAENCVKVYLECDFQMYTTMGSDLLSTVNYVFSLFNEGKTIFENEQIHIEISEIFIWDEMDPYGGNACGGLLDDFVDNRPTFNGDIAHLISTKVTDSGGACGKAHGIGGICGDAAKPGPYCISIGLSSPVNPFPTYSWNLNVFTHEMGHVFGSQHTHACRWNGDNTQIDDCGNITVSSGGDTPEGDACYDEDNPIVPMNGGFIMSYCHQGGSGSFMNLSLGFGTQSGNRMRATIITKGCISDLCSCEEFVDRTVNGMPINSAIYTAENSINSSGDADAIDDNVVIFRAGNFIELNAGFEATELFMAEIVDTLCDEFDSFIEDTNQLVVQNNRNKEANEMRLFPNPTTDQINIQYELDETAEVEIQLLNQYGQLIRQILRKQEQERGHQQLQIDLNNLPNSVYYIVLKTAQQTQMKPFVVSNL